MPEAGARQDGRLRIDMAALHPAIQPDGTGRYHGDCQRLRDAIKVHIPSWVPALQFTGSIE
ncbi:MAG: hypothetical protein OXE82_04320 [Rhodobacter sp.]|nr:hypothetical protein [Rhodobacter sp.]